MKNSKKLNLSILEIVMYSLCALVFLWGLTYIILGLVAKYAPLSSSENEVLKASNSYAKVFKMGFFEYGLIHVGVAWLVGLIVLLIYSKKSDREFEKEQRRAALRASARKSMGISEEETVIEADVVETPVEEAVPQQQVEEPVEEVKAEETPVEEVKDEEAETPAEEAKEPEEKAE